LTILPCCGPAFLLYEYESLTLAYDMTLGTLVGFNAFPFMERCKFERWIVVLTQFAVHQGYFMQQL
jgi:hypothetical protein